MEGRTAIHEHDRGGPYQVGPPCHRAVHVVLESNSIEREVFIREKKIKFKLRK